MSSPCSRLRLSLFDLDVAGAGADADGGAAAVDGAADVMAVEAALHGDGLGDVDAAGAGVCVEVEVGAANDEADGAAAGGELPVGGGLALSFDVAAAGAGFESTGEALRRMLPLPVSALTSPGPVCWSSMSPEPVPRVAAP